MQINYFLKELKVSLLYLDKYIYNFKNILYFHLFLQKLYIFSVKIMVIV